MLAGPPLLPCAGDIQLGHWPSAVAVPRLHGAGIQKPGAAFIYIRIVKFTSLLQRALVPTAPLRQVHSRRAQPETIALLIVSSTIVNIASGSL